MRISILAYGTRGDVQPLMALAVGLQEAGNDVLVSAHRRFKRLVASYGITQHYSKLDFYELMRSGQEGDWDSYDHQMCATARDAADACRHADVFITNSQTSCLADSIAELFDIPYFDVSFFPIFSMPGLFEPMFMSLPEPKTVSDQFQRVIQKQIHMQRLLKLINEVRGTVFGLAAMGKFSSEDEQTYRAATLLAYSEHVVPSPFKMPVRTHVVGYFESAEKPTPPSAKIQAFIASGEPPIYVGFGSMPNKLAEETAAAVLAALQATQQRGVLMLGWGGLKVDALPDTALAVKSIDHRWLFPRVKATIHHGGAGTVAASLQAGKPMIIRPFFVDQPYWGRRMCELGVGCAPIEADKFSAETLTLALQQLLNTPTIQQNAQAVSQRLKQENGVQTAVNLINQYIATRQIRSIAAVTH